MTDKGKVLIAAPVHPVLTEGLEALGYQLLRAEGIRQADAPGLIADCTGVVTSTRLQLDKNLLDAAPRLRWIGRMGSGMEVVDVAYAVSKGINVFASPEGNCNAVAEHALGLLLSLNKRIASSATEVGQGQWRREENRGVEIEGKTVGLIGFGHTGRAFGKLLQAFDARILALDPYNTKADPSYVERCDIECLQRECDILSFHVPIRPDTRHYFNMGFLSALKKPVTLLNTSRGEVVDSEALETGLVDGRIVAAGIDVWEGEPLQAMPEHEKARLARLSALPQVLITPHIAGYSHEALYKMSRALLQKVPD
jgi:D-3-phosphoglycerate dehydrogenase